MVPFPMTLSDPQIVSTVRHYLTLNISETIQDRGVVIQWSTNKNLRRTLKMVNMMPHLKCGIFRNTDGRM